jgi:hypothetical protein
VSRQRRRGQTLVLYRSKTITDNRGNEVKVKDELNPWHVKGWTIPERSAKAELPGDQQINVIRVGVDANLEGVDLWSQAEYQGKPWDVVTPPAYHHGTRHVRHWSINLRERPNG